MKNAAAFDLGSDAGWASLHAGNLMSGLIRSKPSRFDGGGVRFVKFESAVNQLFDVRSPDVVFFEKVHRHLGVAAAHCYAGYLAILTATCEKRDIPYTGLSVQEIKKHATGRGNADKMLMIATAKARWPDQQILTDDVADALWCLDAGLAQNNL